MSDQNLYADLPQTLAGEVFDTLAQGSDLRVERILSRGQSSPASGWYDQELDEWVVVLRGAAVIAYSDGRQVCLGEGDYLHIPAHCRHRVQWTDPDRTTVWLAVHYRAAVDPGPGLSS